MMMSVSMLAEIAIHAKAMADEAQAMAAAIQAVVDDCAGQLAEKKARGVNENGAGKAVKETTNGTDKAVKEMTANGTGKAVKETTNGTGEVAKEPEWVAEAEAALNDSKTKPGKAKAEKKYTLVEVRAFMAERAQKAGREKTKAVLNSFGVSKLTELPEEKYAALMEEVSRL